MVSEGMLNLGLSAELRLGMWLERLETLKSSALKRCKELKERCGTCGFPMEDNCLVCPATEHIRKLKDSLPT